MGSCIADITVRTDRLPTWGETVPGTGFLIGPGGKGSDQAVAAARISASMATRAEVAAIHAG